MKGRHFARKRRSLRTRAATAVSLVLVTAGALLLANIGLFYYNSSHRGAALIRKERAAILAATSHAGTGSHAPTTCTPTGSGSVAGLLQIAKIGLIAPVVEGSGDLQLASAVGHDPSSSWPGGAGTVVLDGHDVTWFHDLPQLAPGDELVYEDPCRSIDYRVVSKRVVSAGAPVYDHPGQLDLVTCYPLDALYLTNQRMVVEAVQVGTEGNQLASISAPAAPDAPQPDVPGAWQSVATLEANPVVLGTLNVSGKPTSVWTQSSAPLDAAGNVQETYFASVREAEQVTPAAWASLHPDVPYTQVGYLHGLSVASNRASLETTLSVQGTTVTAATIVTEPVLDNGSAVTIRASFSVEAGKFVLTGVKTA